MANQDPRELTAPLTFLVTGFALLVFVAVRHTGAAGFPTVMATLTLVAAIRAFVMLLAAFVTAKCIGSSFGAFPSALLKLTAISLFPDGLSQLINIAGISWMINIIAYLSLLVYLFELDLKEAMIFTGVLFVTNMALNFVLISAILAAAH